MLRVSDGGIGHDGGPSLAGGASWRKSCGSMARERLLPVKVAGLWPIVWDQGILVGNPGLEHDWCAAGRCAGYLPAKRHVGQ